MKGFHERVSQVDEPGLWIVLTMISLVGSCFFSVHLIALRTFSRAKLLDEYKKIGRNGEGDRMVDHFVSRVERLILCCSWYLVIFRTLTVIVILMLCYGAFPRYPFLDMLCALCVSLVLMWILSVAIPHAWAKYAGEALLSRTGSFLGVISMPLGPILRLQTLYDGLIRRLAGVVEGTPEEQQEEKQEEFLSELEQHRMEGAVDEEEQEMIENVLELADSTADQIMTPRTDVKAIEVNSDLTTVLNIIIEAGHSRVPVYEENIDNIVGFIYAKDLLKQIGKETGDFELKDHLRDAYFVPETISIRSLLHEFQRQKLHIAVVLDEYGGTAGLVTMEDILEEVVGEIADEYEDSEPESVKQIDEYILELDARTSVDDLNDRFELSLPEEEDYETVGGFVFTQLGYIPKAGESFEYERIKVTILSAEPRRINRLRIERRDDRDND